MLNVFSLVGQGLTLKLPSLALVQDNVLEVQVHIEFILLVSANRNLGQRSLFRLNSVVLLFLHQFSRLYDLDAEFRLRVLG
jgi:hypothetical protein